MIVKKIYYTNLHVDSWYVLFIAHTYFEGMNATGNSVQKVE